jgi:general secretion pathway protein J
MTWTTRKGFTLIEVLVALAVFGVMSMLAYAALGSTLSNADYLSDRMDRLQSIQRAVRYLSTDLFQLVPRPVRNELGDGFDPALETTLSSEFAIELTRGGWGNPAGLPRGTMQRVAYRLEDDELVRYYWTVLDRTYANEPIATVLLDNVESLYFRFYSGDGEFSEVWPPQVQLGVTQIRSRPRAVEIVLTLADQGEIRRLLELAP